MSRKLWAPTLIGNLGTARRSADRPLRSKSRRLRLEILERRWVCTAGALDLSFDGDGKVITMFPGQENADSIAIQSDGKIIAVGTLSSSDDSIIVVRYNTDGSPDMGFGVGGRVSINVIANNSESARDVAIQADGKIVIAGNAANQAALIRLNSDGSLDNSFGVGGKALPNIVTAADIFTSLAFDSSGRIVAAGAAYRPVQNNDFLVARFTASGNLDTSFDGDGVSIVNFVSVGGSASDYELAEDVLVDDFDRIVTVGFAGSSGTGISRHSVDGTLDGSFGTGGFVLTTSGIIARSGVLQPDGKIVVGGTNNSASPHFALARYLSNGSLDTSFDGDGKVLTILANATFSGIESVMLQPDGKIVAVGYGQVNPFNFFGLQDNQMFAVARYLTNGSLDTTFDVDGKAITDFAPGGNFYDRAVSGALQSDGKIVALGYNGLYGAFDFALARYQGDPQLADAGGPYSVPEGGSVMLTGSAPDVAPPAAVFEWDLDADGIFGEVGSNAARGNEVGRQPIFSAVGVDGSRIFTVTLRVTDQGQPTAYDTAVVNVRNVAPTISVVDLSMAEIDEGQSVTVTGEFIDPAFGLATESFSGTALWSDGTTSVVTIVGNTFTSTHNIADDKPTGTESDSLTVTVTVSDDDFGSDTETSGTITVNNKAPTIIAVDLSVAEIDEGQSVTVTGMFTDPAYGAATETFTGTALWSDGATSFVTIVGNAFSSTRSFADDDPTGTVSDTFTVAITILDDDSGSNTGYSGTLTVKNVEPVLAELKNSSPDCGDAFMGVDTVTIAANFTDLGMLDTHQVSINWGDGNITPFVPVATEPNGMSAGTVSGSHVYETGGLFTITVTLRDDDGGTSQLQTTATVGGIGLTPAGQLQIVGADGKDVIHLKRHANDGGSDGGSDHPANEHIHIKAKMDLTDEGGSDGGSDGGFDISFNRADIASILIIGCGGNDQIHLDADITIDAAIDGGEGNDHIIAGSGHDTIIDLFGNNHIQAGDGNDTVTTGDGMDRISGEDGEDLIFAGGGKDNADGGEGNDIVVGGDGNDDLDGGKGRDILIGGLGADKLKGSDGDDVLIAGFTSYDDNAVALIQLLAEWTSSGIYATRVNNLRTGGGLTGGIKLIGDDEANQTVFNDDDVDVLEGNKDLDVFWANLFADNGGAIDIVKSDSVEVKLDSDF